MNRPGFEFLRVRFEVFASRQRTPSRLNPARPADGALPGGLCFGAVICCLSGVQPV